ncbi:hypothetical protein ACFPOI_59490 [Nonomuraea angiospora]|uniref:XRE family transcriptional regulator n=1 Tax=Nonomuraea angiospora TaxID=46172 RepID=A0ABR9LQE2_9ACTN|nr:hypothetical protein [Nonomuraea angiospora]MBE1582858.1 hypothetical protein [Nonomuraea angiospora]
MSEAPQGDQDPRPAAEATEGGLESVTSPEDLVKLLAEQFARADVSLRELQTRADRAGGTRLPRSTCADMLAGRRFPKKAVMVAFLRGCRVPDHRLPAWERAWERVRVHQLPAGSREIATQAMTEPGTTDTPRAARWRRRRATLLAAVAVSAAAAILGVVIAQRATPQPGASEGVPGHIVNPAHIVSDDGRAFPRGGSSRFTVRVSPANTGVRLTRRLDAGVGLQQATITVNGSPAAEWRPLLEDGIYKWRDQIVTIPPDLTRGRGSLTIVTTCVSPSGFNEFLYTVEHEVDGVWSTADTIDIGRDHAASEAAHDYRVVGEDWAGTQTFAYPPRKEAWSVQ